MRRNYQNDHNPYFKNSIKNQKYNAFYLFDPQPQTKEL